MQRNIEHSNSIIREIDHWTEDFVRAVRTTLIINKYGGKIFTKETSVFSPMYRAKTKKENNNLPCRSIAQNDRILVKGKIIRTITTVDGRKLVSSVFIAIRKVSPFERLYPR